MRSIKQQQQQKRRQAADTPITNTVVHTAAAAADDDDDNNNNDPSKVQSLTVFVATQGKSLIINEQIGNNEEENDCSRLAASTDHQPLNDRQQHQHVQQVALGTTIDHHHHNQQQQQQQQPASTRADHQLTTNACGDDQGSLLQCSVDDGGGKQTGRANWLSLKAALVATGAMPIEEATAASNNTGRWRRSKSEVTAAAITIDGDSGCCRYCRSSCSSVSSSQSLISFSSTSDESATAAMLSSSSQLAASTFGGAADKCARAGATVGYGGSSMYRHYCCRPSDCSNQSSKRPDSGALTPVDPTSTDTADCAAVAVAESPAPSFVPCLHRTHHKSANFDDRKSILLLDTTNATNKGVGMDSFCNQSLEERLKITPLNKGGYPNNTLIVDLCKCHRNITSLWPNRSSCRRRTGGSSWLSLTEWWPSFCRPGNGFHVDSCDSNVRPRTRRRARLQFHMPDPLLRTDVSLKLEEYDKALSVLTSDIRYHLHLLLYRRIRTLWLLLSTILCVLAPVVLTNLESLMILCAFTSWLSLQIAGVFFTTQFRSKLDQMMEKSVAQVNSFLMDHNLMLGVINVGCLFSKSKLIIPMLYFNTTQCREQIESIISIDSRKDADGKGDNSKQILDYSRIDLPLTRPTNTVALAQSQLAKKIILRYSQRWISYFDKRKLMFTDDRIRPRHLSTGKCLCQFIEEHFSNNNETIDKQHCEQEHLPKARAEATATTVVNTTATNFLPYIPATKIPLPSINERKQQQQLQQQQQYLLQQAVKQQQEQQKQLADETQVRRKVIGNQEACNALPTISKLVSSRDQTSVPQATLCQDHLTIDMITSDNSTQKCENQSKPQGFTVLNSWHYLLGTESEQQIDKTACDLGKFSPNSNQQQTPTTSSPDLSMEMGCDSISRSDDLVRKLRLLLELRKNDLQGIDGTELFSSALSKTEALQPPLLIIPNDISAQSIKRPKTIDQNGYSLASSKNQLDADNNHVTTKINGTGGKRFYIQKDGFFFFGGGKRSQPQQQQQQHNNTKRDVLEIC